MPGGSSSETRYWLRRLPKTVGDLTGNLTGLVVLLVGLVVVVIGRDAGGTYGDIGSEIGYVLIGTVTVAYLYELTLRRRHDADFLELLHEGLLPGSIDYGLVGVHPRVDFGGLVEPLRKGDELLWLDTYCPDQAQIERGLRNALESGATIRMLAIDPRSDLAALRADEIRPELGYTPEQFADEAQVQLDHLWSVVRQLTPDLRRGITVRLYRDLPCVPMYLHSRGSNRGGYTGFFLRDPTFDQPHLEWRFTDTGFFPKLVEYFEQKWDRAANRQVCWCSHAALHLTSACPTASR
jgi:hypothetical protein